MTNDKKRATIELLDRLSDLSCELDELSSRARWIEDHIDEARYELMDLRNVTAIDIVEEDEGEK